MTHQFLRLKEEYQLSKPRVEKELQRLFNILGLKSDVEIKIRRGKTERTYLVTDLYDELRKKGYLEELQKIIDQKNRLYYPSISFSMTMRNAKFTMKRGGKEQGYKGPGSMIPVEKEITDDILFYREEACKESVSTDFNKTRMFYRAYLLSCISLLDAFIQICILVLQKKDKQPRFIGT